MTKSKILFYFCLSFIIGIFLNSITKIPQTFLLGFLFSGVLLIFTPLFLKKDKIIVLGFCILFLVLGISRLQMAEFKIINNELGKYNNTEQDITLIGRVSEEPDIREKNTKLTMKVSGEKVLITTNKYPEYKYGDELKIKGRLKTPVVFEDFNYKDYLAKEGIYSVIYWPKIELIDKNQGNFIYPYYQNFGVWVYSKILFFKNKLRESIYQNLSPPQSSILGAMILGDKRRMSDNLKEKLNISGLRHITAVSGMHVAILTTILMTLLIGLGLWRGQAFYLTIVIISLFIIMTGLQPSAIRAGIMGGFFLLAQHLGKMNSASRIIVFVAAVMLVQNPLLLRLDVGFQLSFLAMLGIIYLLPIFQSLLKRISNIFQFRNILAMTLSAQVFTLPILIYNFGYVSLVSPLSNILIVPFLPYIIGFGSLFAFVGIVWQFLGWVLSFPCWLLLTYLTKIVDFFSQPWALKSIENVHWFWLAIFYLILSYLIWRLNKKQKLNFLDF